MTKKNDGMKKSDAVKLAADFNKNFKVGDEITVLGDKGRWIGVVAAVALVSGKAPDFKIEAHIFEGSCDDFRALQETKELPLFVEVAIDKIRERAIEVKTVTNPHRVKLTVEERLVLADEVADIDQEIQDLKDDLKTYSERIRSQIKEKELSLSAKCGTQRQGFEVRPVECELVLDFDTGSAHEVRKDTGEASEPRPLKHEEKEMELRLFPQPQAEKPEEPKDDSQPDLPEQEQEPAPKPEKTKVDEGMVASAIQILKDTQRASAGSLANRLKIKPGLASEVLMELEKREIVGPAKDDGSPRDIIANLDNLEG